MRFRTFLKYFSSGFYFTLIITYLILIIVKGFKNLEYNKYNSPTIINERVLYEQLSYEIYDSIKSPLILDLKIDAKCEDNYRPINITLKLNPHFNSKYNTKISHLFNKQFCIPKYELFGDKYKLSDLQYEEFIKHKINIKDDPNIYTKNVNDLCEKGYKPCGILDTKYNVLCLPEKYECPLNDLKIGDSNDTNLINAGYTETELDNNISLYLNTNKNIVRPIIISLFLSYDRPWDHEWSKIIAYENDKDKKDETKEKRELFSFENYDEYMKNVFDENNFLISLNDIISWEEKELDFNLEDAKISKHYNLFYKNYIGFEDDEAFQKFKKLFNMDDYADNPLYKLSKTLRPSIASIVFGFLFIILLIVIYFFLALKEREPFPAFIFACLFTLAFSTIYIGLYFSDFVKFKKMIFNFDEQIQKVFELYSKRNKQPIYTSLIIIMFITLTPYLVLLGGLTYKGLSETYYQIKRYCGFCGIC